MLQPPKNSKHANRLELTVTKATEIVERRPVECVDYMRIHRYSSSLLILVLYQIDVPSLAFSLCLPSGLKM